MYRRRARDSPPRSRRRDRLGSGRRLGGGRSRARSARSAGTCRVRLPTSAEPGSTCHAASGDSPICAVAVIAGVFAFALSRRSLRCSNALFSAGSMSVTSAASVTCTVVLASLGCRSRAGGHDRAGVRNLRGEQRLRSGRRQSVRGSSAKHAQDRLLALAHALLSSSRLWGRPAVIPTSANASARPRRARRRAFARSPGCRRRHYSLVTRRSMRQISPSLLDQLDDAQRYTPATVWSVSENQSLQSARCSEVTSPGRANVSDSLAGRPKREGIGE